MKFRIKDLKNYIQGEINWKNTADLLNLKSFETTFNKKYLDIDFLPNRFPDAACLIGLAEEIGVITNNQIIFPKNKIKTTKEKINKFIKLKNFTPLDTKLSNGVRTQKCIYYSGRIVLGVKNQQSPQWLKEFVEFYGFNSVNLLVDLSNFVMMEYGAPIHIFDLDKISGDFILRESKKGEKFCALSGKEFLLQEGAVVIENNGKIIDLVGIQGGEAVKTELKTKNILIQAPIIEPESIRLTSKKINFGTDASYRFERGVSVISVDYGMERISSLIQSLAGGKVLSENLSFGQAPNSPKIILRLKTIKNYSGFDLTIKQIEAILKKIGCSIIKSTNNFVYVETPKWRLDLKIEEDLIEEIIRIEGWDKIKSTLPKTTGLSKEDDILSIQDLSKNIITSFGFDEVLNYSFISDDDINNFESILNDGKVIKALNPINKNYSVFRPVVFINLLKTARKNLNTFKEIRIFEIGHCASLLNNKINEKAKLGFLISLPNLNDSLLEINGDVRLFFEKIGFDVKIKNAYFDIFESSAIINLENKTQLGFMGLLNKELTKKYDLDQRIVLAEFDLELILKNLEQERAYQPIPEFPAISRDISLIIPEIAQIDHIENEIQYLGGDFLESVSLFDVFQMENMPDKKSVSFRLVFRASDRSLTDNEINKVMQKISHSLVDKFGAGIR